MISSLHLSRKEEYGIIPSPLLRCGDDLIPSPFSKGEGDYIILSSLSKDEEMITTLLLPRKERKWYNPISSLERKEML
jgi:hypothetical protein